MSGNRKKVAILGVGLLGGSLALALKKQKKFSLLGWNHRPASRRRAAKLIPMAASLEAALEGADIVLLCTHSSEVLSLLPELPRRVAEDALILDVSSVKGEIVERASLLSWAPYHFVPCHPMAGKEKSGPENAEAGLYAGKVVFLTPLPKTPRSVLKAAVSFWRGLGARPQVMAAKKHDQFVALTSHLPHLLAAALVEVYGDYAKKNKGVAQAVGSGFRDGTRVAAGNPAMWADILGLNGENIALFLARYRRRLADLEKRLGKKNGGDWNRYFAQAKKIRKRL